MGKFPRSVIFAVLGCQLLLATLCWGGQDKEFGGIGLQVVPTVRGELVVLRVLENSPAAQGGLQPGDLIVEVDAFSLRGSDFSQVVKQYLWGKVGSTVTLKYMRPGQLGHRLVKLQRVAMDPDTASPPGVQMILPSK